VHWRPAQFCLRTLAAAIGCVLLLQVFLSGLEAALAFGRASAGEFFVICHGDGGTTPANGDKDRKLPCSLCALAVGGALPAAAISVAAAQPSSSGVAGCKEKIALITPAPARDGLSRAPPHRG
jgi:ABC-type enterobactin transport system permease subunit